MMITEMGPSPMEASENLDTSGNNLGSLQGVHRKKSIDMLYKRRALIEQVGTLL